MVFKNKSSMIKRDQVTMARIESRFGEQAVTLGTLKRLQQECRPECRTAFSLSTRLIEIFNIIFIDVVRFGILHHSGHFQNEVFFVSGSS